MKKNEYEDLMGISNEQIMKKVKPNKEINSGAYWDILEKVKSSQINNALEIAKDNRDFEIKRYWHRAFYYCAFMTSIFIAYLFVLKSSEFFIHQDIVLFCIILIGCIFSFAWVLTNIGSRFWQENWQLHINYLESEVCGNLHKLVLSTKVNKFRPSIGRINLGISYLILLIWICLLIHNIWGEWLIKNSPLFNFVLQHPILLKLVCVSAIAGIFTYFVLKKEKHENVEVYKEDYTIDKFNK